MPETPASVCAVVHTLASVRRRGSYGRGPVPRPLLPSGFVGGLLGLQRLPGCGALHGTGSALLLFQACGGSIGLGELRGWRHAAKYTSGSGDQSGVGRLTASTTSTSTCPRSMLSVNPSCSSNAAKMDGPSVAGAVAPSTEGNDGSPGPGAHSRSERDEALHGGRGRLESAAGKETNPRPLSRAVVRLDGCDFESGWSLRREGDGRNHEQSEADRDRTHATSSTSASAFPTRRSGRDHRDGVEQDSRP